MKKILIALLILIQGYVNAQNNEEWDDYFMPGIGYKAYFPKNTDSLGVYQGISTEFVIYARAKGWGSRLTGPARVKLMETSVLCPVIIPKQETYFLQTLG